LAGFLVFFLQRLALGTLQPNAMNQHANLAFQSESQPSYRQKRKRIFDDEQEDMKKMSQLATKVQKLRHELSEMKSIASEESMKNATLEEQLASSAREIAALQATVAAQKSKYRQLLADAASKLEQQESRISSLSCSLDQAKVAPSFDGPFSQFLQVDTIPGNDGKLSWKLKMSVGKSALEFLLLQVPESDLLEYRPVTITNMKKVPSYIQDAVFFSQAQLPVWLSKVLATMSQPSS
jgi:hypothetical protein